MFAPAEYTLRPLAPEDEPILWEMLYLALPRSEEEPPPRELMQEPHYARYVAGWGEEGDRGFLAQDKSGVALGAVWLRNSLGSGQGESPAEIPFVVRQGHRKHGIGASLLTQLVRANPALSAVLLHVGRAGAAVRLFERFGFEVTGESEAGVVMHRHL